MLFYSLRKPSKKELIFQHFCKAFLIPSHRTIYFLFLTSFQPYFLAYPANEKNSFITDSYQTSVEIERNKESFQNSGLR